MSSRVNVNLEIPMQMRGPGTKGPSGPSASGLRRVCRDIENQVLSLDSPTNFPGPELAALDHFFGKDQCVGDSTEVETCEDLPECE